MLVLLHCVEASCSLCQAFGHKLFQSANPLFQSSINLCKLDNETLLARKEGKSKHRIGSHQENSFWFSKKTANFTEKNIISSLANSGNMKICKPNKRLNCSIRSNQKHCKMDQRKIRSGRFDKRYPTFSGF